MKKNIYEKRRYRYVSFVCGILKAGAIPLILCLMNTNISARNKITRFSLLKNAELESSIPVIRKITNIDFADTVKKKPPIRLSGTVSDESGKALSGVSVYIRGSKTGTTTNENGEYLLNFRGAEGSIIVFSFTGKKRREIPYSGKNVIHIVLENSENIMEEVIVSTGYHRIDRRELTSAVTTIKAEDIITPGLNTVDQMLEGRVPGLIFMQNSGQLGATPRLRIRGTTTVLGSQEPLWVVDGVIVQDPVNIDPLSLNDLDFVNLLGNAVSGLNPEDIEQIDILKDASATAIYGKEAANGVIVITTKKGPSAPPTVSYSVSGNYTRRPHYTDKSVNVMNSKERIAFSREIIEKRIAYPIIDSWVGYEAAYRDYIDGSIDFREFKRLVNKYETMNTDWFALLTRNAYSHKHTVSVSGGSPAVKYYASAGFNHSQGNIRGESNKQYTTSINLTGNYNRFDIRFGLQANTSEKHHIPTDIGAMEYAYNTSRAISPYTENGDFLRYLLRDRITKNRDNYPFNIIEDMENGSYDINTNGTNFQTDISYRIIEGLKAKIVASYAFSNTRQETYHGENTYYGRCLRHEYDHSENTFKSKSLMPIGGELKESHTNRKSYMLRFQTDFNRFTDADHHHSISATIGGELKSNQYKTYTKTSRGYVPERGLIVLGVPGIKDFKEYLEWTQTNEALGIHTVQKRNDVSAYLSLGYGYRNIYYFNFNARVDFSNEFGSRAREKFFPIWSASGRWNMKEDILPDTKWINALSLRGSFGYQGNVPNVATELVIKKGGIHREFGEYVSTIEKYPNPNLKWEKTASVNTALDFSFHNRKIHGSLSFYYRKTVDAYMSKAIPEINGITSYTVNEGTIINRGYELTVNFTPVNSMNAEGKGWKWRFDPQFGQVINKLIDKAVRKTDKSLRDDDDITYRDYLNGTVQSVNRSINGFYSYNFIGLDPKDGRPLFRGINETVYENGEEIDYKEIYKHMTNEERFMSVMSFSGNRVPTLQGGITNTVAYNDFILSFNLAYSIGSKVRLLRMYPNINSDNGTIAPLPVENVRREYADRWKKPGDELHTNIPGIISGNDFIQTLHPWWNDVNYTSKVFKLGFSDNIWEMYDYSDIRVVSGNYLKMSQLSIRYNIPKPVCERFRLKTAYIALTGTNLFILCSKKLKGQDPATQSGNSSRIPMSTRSTYSFSLNISL